MNTPKTLNILQYNVRKSKDTVMATLLRDTRSTEFDIIAIQEPWRNPFMETTHHPAKDIFHLCYPPGSREEPARVCLFVNKRLDHAKWHFNTHSRDVCSITIETTAEGQDNQQTTIYNVYNAVDQIDTLNLLRDTLARDESIEQMVLRDFNLHHSLWGGDRVHRPDTDARELISLKSGNIDDALGPASSRDIKKGDENEAKTQHRGAVEGGDRTREGMSHKERVSKNVRPGRVKSGINRAALGDRYRPERRRKPTREKRTGKFAPRRVGALHRAQALS